MPQYRSEIRASQLSELTEKVQRNSYGKYLSKVKLVKVRGFDDESVKFDFPVTAIIGPNGGGKTTVLGAAGCAYLDVKPQRFFARSGSLDDTMQNWKIEYELVDKRIAPRDVIRRTSTFRSQKWYRDALKRDVIVFGVSRTVPAIERVELKKYASTSLSVSPEQIADIEEQVLRSVEKILGRDMSGYRKIQLDARGKVSLLSGKTKEDVQYSEFHFGAGESSIIHMVMRIEALPENSLILIEEIENGLHPLATQRMVEYLIDVAERKSAQIIFTTHSNYALAPLPSQAIWASINGKMFQGKLDINSLRAITNEIEAQLVVFTEDKFSAEWVKTMIRMAKLPSDIIEVHHMAGDGMAVSINKYHNADPSRRFESICFLDGDSEQQTSEEDKVLRLPGQCPETYIFNNILDAFDSVGGKLALALHQPFEAHESIRDLLESVRRTNRDPHLLFSQVGERLGFLTESVVRSAFLSIWASSNTELVRSLMSPLTELLSAATRS